MKSNNLTAIKADKSKTIVIIDKDQLQTKVNEFIKDNNILLLNKDPTEKYKKLTQQSIKNANSIIEKIHINI